MFQRNEEVVKRYMQTGRLAAAVLLAFAVVLFTDFEAQADTTFSANWIQDEKGNWHIRDKNSNWIRDAWVCDDAVAENGKDVWYLLDAGGNLVTAGLVQDQTGNFYSLETNHNGYYGMLRYRSGTYDGIPLVLESSHTGSFAAIRNQAGIDALKAKYGLTTVNISNENIVYTSNEKIQTATTEGWAKYANGTWYYYENQERVKGWKEIDGVYYYFNKTNGAMLVNSYTPDGYYVGADGAWDGKAANQSKITSTSKTKTGTTKTSGSTTGSTGTSSGSSASGPGTSDSSTGTSSGSSTSGSGSSTGNTSAASGGSDSGSSSSSGSTGSSDSSGNKKDSGKSVSTETTDKGPGSSSSETVTDRGEDEPEWDSASATKLYNYANSAKTVLANALGLYQEGQKLTVSKDIVKKYNQACGKACGILDTLGFMVTLAEERPAVSLADGTALTSALAYCEGLVDDIGCIFVDEDTDLQSDEFLQEMNKISTLYDKMTAIEELARKMK